MPHRHLFGWIQTAYHQFFFWKTNKIYPYAAGPVQITLSQWLSENIAIALSREVWVLTQKNTKTVCRPTSDRIRYHWLPQTHSRIYSQHLRNKNSATAAGPVRRCETIYRLTTAHQLRTIRTATEKFQFVGSMTIAPRDCSLLTYLLTYLIIICMSSRSHSFTFYSTMLISCSSFISTIFLYCDVMWSNAMQCNTIQYSTI